MKVTLRCRDEVDIVIPLEIAKESGTLSQILDNDYFIESQSNEIELEDFDSEIVQIVVEYLHYKHDYKDIPEKANGFKFDVSRSPEVLVCADFLNC